MTNSTNSTNSTDSVNSTVSLITRADDCGNCESHNLAIAESCKHGIVRNVSVMATGAALDHAAALFAGDRSICFGLHATMNAEWETFRWKPLLPASEVSTLVEADGYFKQHPGLWLAAPPDVEQILSEMKAQLDKLRAAGFAITYADSHMFFEWAIKGLDAAFDAWCVQEGLISHRPFTGRLPEISGDDAGESVVAGDPVDQFVARLKHAAPGQYLIVGHPGYDDEETRSWGNSDYPGTKVAQDRHWERLMFTDKRVLDAVRSGGVRLLRYDEAQAL
ncbi:ChbG/HpnK family deacetylase [Paenibacillus lignilyticus]|uniref:ChbG/HpnK family deacetylase n=1 Tax=Paenibacillus lignilyticus TaxID=1172615 RepID=A0ABS5CCD4_9BACL|nr:ChbG/HpnK family deacetylase [Paenibacillus lignilyticus]MBP3961700.1 ChbG/HpnK family deacetylase [Paenibacillus lignilyticus]MBP3963629.1 ChbG/HpnK family deacetylase [Paenibacillus lignilyticus]